jgi:hypothetical protein|tara:strand:+ start:139 stop:420 length:282 start_codon:yes stop_codon:yes gene_type:complete
MAKWTNLEISDLQILTDEEIRDVVAHFTTSQEPLSQRQADLLQEAELWLQEDEVEMRDYWNDIADDVEADADALVSAGWGTDEDYGYYGGDEY